VPHGGLFAAASQELAKAAATRDATDDDAVLGVRPGRVVSPASTDQVGEVLRVAAQHDLAVLPRGSGTKLAWGTPPARLDVVLDTTGLTGVVDHAAGDLVVVVRAGTAMTELQRVVGQAGQQLALDAPYPEATVGGTLATATSGPRRLLYGTARDLLIGITFVRADGVVAKAGGRVVKNVAGYDFGKLLTGSYGTLGVVTEAVFRLHPLPAARRVVQASFPDAATAAAAALGVVGSQVVPTAVELDGAAGAVRVTVLLEGVEAGVAGRTDAVLGLLGADATTTDEPPAGFAALPFETGGTGLKATCSLSGVGSVLGAAHALGRRLDLDLTVRGSAAGVLYAGLPADADTAAVATLVEGLRAAAAPYDGTVTVLTAPAAVRDAVDVWGPVPGLELMRRLKDEMDPQHRLSPGRFVGGIS
jgi:glycolate oxidase FAD binding subunit